MKFSEIQTNGTYRLLGKTPIKVTSKIEPSSLSPEGMICVEFLDDEEEGVQPHKKRDLDSFHPSWIKPF